MDSRLPDIARTTAASHGMFAGGGPVVVMVSGGADSVSLLRLLASGALGEQALSVLHVNHLLRGDAADGDAAFVEDLCASLGVPCRTVRYDVAAFAEAEGLNLEDAGRQVRYRFAEEELDAACAAAGADPATGRVAVAHTLDDRIETTLMRFASGSGAGGLAGIRHVRGRIVRPLLDARRADVVAYLDGLAAPWREDATNADVTRTRARVRAELLPLLRELNPRFDDAMRRMWAVLGDDDELLDGMAAAFARDFAQARSGEVRIERSRMATLSRAMGRRTLRRAIADAFPEASRIEYEHIDAVVAAMGEDGFARDLGHGLRAHDEYGTLIISRSPGEAVCVAPSLLEVPGSADLGPAGTIDARSVEPVPENDPRTAVIDADRLRGPLTVDSVRPGDRMRPLGMQGTRKLQDVLTDAKVPRRARAGVPVVRDGDSIVWVAGVRISDEYALGPGTVHAVRLTWTGPADTEE